MSRIEKFNIDDNTYEVGKIASTTNLGVVRIGNGLSITEEGVLSSSGGSEVILYPTTGQNTDGAMTQKATTDALTSKADAATLSAVATTGLYADLIGKPTIPTVNNATLTIQKNGTEVATFTANSATAATANITVPTATSDLTNDSGFVSVTLSTTDIGEGATLAANTLYGVYE